MTVSLLVALPAAVVVAEEGRGLVDKLLIVINVLDRRTGGKVGRDPLDDRRIVKSGCGPGAG